MENVWLNDSVIDTRTEKYQWDWAEQMLLWQPAIFAYEPA
jgi:hypothetical protein